MMEKEQMTHHSFGFIMSRYVRCETTNKYWIESCTCIRSLYPDAPIIIVDDHSDEKFLTDNNFENVEIIESEYDRGVAELLPYLYFHRRKPFDIAIILNDGTFLQQRFDATVMTDIDARPIWEFAGYLKEHPDAYLIHCLNHADELLEIYHPANYRGCFASMSIISWSFLDFLMERHNLYELQHHVNTRPTRCGLERVLGVLFQKHSRNSCAIVSDIFLHPQPFELTFDGYKSMEKGTYPIYKVWSMR